MFWGYDIGASVTFSPIIIHDSFRIICNHGSIHINVDVLETYSILIYNKSDSKMTQYIIYHSLLLGTN